MGKQWLKWMDGKRRYTTDTDVPPYRQQPVTNVTYAIYRTLAAKLTKQKPTLEVVPPSGDSDDRESAALGQAILVHLWRLLKHPAKIRRGIGWFLCTGQVYLRVHWDAEAGTRRPITQPIEVPHPDPALAAAGETVDVECPCDAQGNPHLTPEGMPDLDAEPASMPQGEIAFDIESPLAVRFNAEACDADDATEMYVAKLWPRKHAAKHFGCAEEEIEANSDTDRQMYDDLLSSAATGSGWLGSTTTIGSTLGASQDQALGSRVLVVEYYRKPDDDRPEGAHWISIGRTVVWPKPEDPDHPNSEAPLPDGFWPPLIPVLALPIPGQPQALGALPQVVPLNEQLNALDGKILEHEVTMAMGGKWVVHPDDRGLIITSDPAQVLASKGYAQGKPPIQAELKPLPAEVYNERTVILDKIRMVMSLSEAELGKKPEGVSAGRAFLVLQEVTDSVLGPDLQAWEEALEEVGRRELVLAQRYYREDRSIQIRGERGKWEVRSFTGSDLTDGLDVRVQVGSSFPWSRAAQWDTKLSVLSEFPGLVQRPDGTIDQEKFSRFVDVSGIGLQSFESDEDPDLVEVDREHAMFEVIDPAQGEQQIPQLAFWQDHQKHLEAHTRFLKRDYARFLRWSQAGQEAFIDHIRRTMIAVEQQAGVALAAAQPAAPPVAAGGALPPEGPPDGGDPGGLPNPNMQPTLSRADLASARPRLTAA